MAVIIRPAYPTDWNYILDTFRLTWTQDRRGKAIPWDRWSGVLIDLINRWETIVACEESVPDEILGWMIYLNRSVLGYLHVRQVVRGTSVARRMLRHSQCLHRSVQYVASPLVPLRSWPAKSNRVKYWPWSHLL